MKIPKELNDEIWNFCRENNITNIDDFTLKLLKQGFTAEKYGATPIQKTIEVEKIVEKIIEKVIEVPVEKIVEVPVTMVDTELSDNLKKYMKLYEDSQKELNNNLKIISELKKQLEIEKNKNKKDLYGE